MSKKTNQYLKNYFAHNGVVLLCELLIVLLLSLICTMLIGGQPKWLAPTLSVVAYLLAELRFMMAYIAKCVKRDQAMQAEATPAVAPQKPEQEPDEEEDEDEIEEAPVPAPVVDEEIVDEEEIEEYVEEELIEDEIVEEVIEEIVEEEVVEEIIEEEVIEEIVEEEIIEEIVDEDETKNA